MKQSQAQWEDFLNRRLDPYAGTKYRILLGWLGDLRGATALVVGSGSGEFAASLALAGARVDAVDIDRESVGLTLEAAKRAGASVEAWTSRLEDLEPEARYDLVAATDVIEHIEDDAAAAARLVALTKAGGRLVVTVPALQALFGYHDEVLGHYRRYTAGSLRALFSGPGVTVERCRYFGLLLIPVAWAVSCLLRRPYPVAAVGEREASGGAVASVLKALFRFERAVSPPLGTSVLMLARVGAAQRRP